MEFKFDDFLISIDVSGNRIGTAVLLIKSLSKKVKNKIHVIDFLDANLRRYFTIDENKSKEFIENSKTIINKTIFVDSAIKSFEWLEEYLCKLDKEDYLFINGAERLLPYKETKPLLNTEHMGLKTQTHFKEDEDWEGLSIVIDELYGKYQEKVKGIYINIYTDKKSREVILNALDSSNNMSIISSDIPGECNEYEELQRSIFDKIKILKLKEALEFIEGVKIKLDKNTYTYMLAMAHYHHGDISRSIEILESNYDNILKEVKLMLADLHTASGNNIRAGEILEELFKKDRYLQGLFPALLRLYDINNPEEHEYWLNIATEIDPQNPAIIELKGSWYANNNEFAKAAIEFRKLKSILNPDYYELVARFNEVLDNEKMDYKEVYDYIFYVVESNPSLKNEAVYRVARYFIEYKNSYFQGYKVLREADFNVGKPRIREIADMKINILIDEVKASEALRKLKPHKKSKDAAMLNNERSVELIKLIQVLSAENKGYLSWRRFIQDSQSNDTWLKSINNRLVDILVSVNQMDIKDVLTKSYLKEHLNEEVIRVDILDNPEQSISNIIILLRAIRSGKFDINSNFEDFDEFMQAMLTLPEVLGDNKSMLWTRYYISIIASLHGRAQDASNHALSILEYYPRIDSEYKDLTLLLGLIAWGNSQYRVGRVVEGLSCIIASFNFVQNIDEIYPFLEEGVNIITRYFSDNNIIEKNFEIWEIFNEKIKGYNQGFSDAWKIKNEDSQEIISDLEKRVKSIKEKDVNWAGHVVNLVSCYAKDKKMDEAINTINKYGKSVIDLLENRKDVRFEILYNWAWIYFSNAKGINEYFIALNFAEIAIHDIEEKRLVSHKEERASIGVLSDEIYRFFLQICSSIISLHEMREEMFDIFIKKVENILPKISPRAVIEQKDYYLDDSISKEASEIEKKLEIVMSEYDNLFKSNRGDIDLLSEKTKIIIELTNKLKEIHPHYMDLKEIDPISFTDIQNLLKDKEVFYQYIITPISITTVLITNESLVINPQLTLMSKKNVQEMALDFSEYIQGNRDYKDEEIDNLIISISDVVARELLDYVVKNDVDTVYYMPDFNMGMFPLSVCRTKDTSLIDNIKSIINIIDYRVLSEDEKELEINKIANRIIGNPNDSEMKKIFSWLEKKENESIILIENTSDSLIDIEKIIDNEDIKSAAFYAHGVSDPSGSLIDGAMGLQGRKSIIKLDDIINKVKGLENLILISCRGGFPNSKNPENSNGTWSAIFEQFSGNVIACKWDVPTDSTIELVNELFDFSINGKMNIDKALLSAQKKIKIKYKDPKFWAGIEIWQN